MAEPVNIHAAKTNLSKLIEAAEAGEEVIHVQHGLVGPVARVQEVLDACRSAGFASIEIGAGKSLPQSINSDPPSPKDSKDPEKTVAVQLKNVAAADAAKVIQDLFHRTDSSGQCSRAREHKLSRSLE